MALTRNEIKFLKSLQEKKVRERERLFIVEGVKLVNELLQQKLWRIQVLYHTSGFDVLVPSQVNQVLISDSDLERISGLVSPNKVFAVVHYPDTDPKDWENEKLILVLDEIKDPGNLGTILRTADWFGIKFVMASENCVDLFNPKVIQASMGAVYRMNYFQDNLEKKLADLKKSGFTLVGADMTGTDLFTYSYPKKMALVMGSESHGLSERVKEMLHEKITIPKFGETESLNVGIAAGIILSDYKRAVGT